MVWQFQSFSDSEYKINISSHFISKPYRRNQIQVMQGLIPANRVKTYSKTHQTNLGQHKVVILFHEKKNPSQDFILKTLDLNWQYLLHVTLNFCGNCIKARRYYVWPIVLHLLYVPLQLTCNISCKVQRYFFLMERL